MSVTESRKWWKRLHTDSWRLSQVCVSRWVVIWPRLSGGETWSAHLCTHTEGFCRAPAELVIVLWKPDQWGLNWVYPQWPLSFLPGKLTLEAEPWASETPYQREAHSPLAKHEMDIKVCQFICTQHIRLILPWTFLRMNRIYLLLSRLH